MTLVVRNSVLLSGMLLALIALVAFGLAAAFVMSGPVAESVLETVRVQHWFWATWEVNPLHARMMLASAALLGLFAFLGILVMTRVFRRVNSPEIYFVALFLMTACAELARLAVPLTEILALPVLVPLVVTRFVLFARIMGGLALFSAGVYAAGADYPRTGSLTLLLAALAFVIIYFVPVDNSVPTASFLFATGAQLEIDFLLGFLAVGTIVNYLIGWYRGYHDQNGWLVLAASSLAVGKQMVLHLSSPVVLVVGLLLVGMGILGIVLVNRAYYLWS